LVGAQARRTGLEERGGASHARQGTGLGGGAGYRGIVAIKGVLLGDVGKGSGLCPGGPCQLLSLDGGLERRLRYRSPRKDGPSPRRGILVLLLLQTLLLQALLLCSGWLFRSVLMKDIVVAIVVVFQQIRTRHGLEEMLIERDVKGGRQHLPCGSTRGGSVVVIDIGGGQVFHGFQRCWLLSRLLPVLGKYRSLRGDVDVDAASCNVNVAAVLARYRGGAIVEFGTTYVVVAVHVHVHVAVHVAVAWRVRHGGCRKRQGIQRGLRGSGLITAWLEGYSAAPILANDIVFGNFDHGASFRFVSFRSVPFDGSCCLFVTE